MNLLTFVKSRYNDIETTTSQRRRVESCVRKRKAAEGRSEPIPKDFKICWASIKGSSRKP